MRFKFVMKGSGWRRGLLFAGLLAGGGLAGAVSNARADSTRRRRVSVASEGVVRFLRSVSVGLVISLDYWWAGWGVDDVS
jgi:hypothetical protein